MKDLEGLFGALEADPGVLFFPVRHHSPACSRHLARLIREARPASIVIEGPDDLTPLIPLILHPRTRAPFAAYTTYADREHGRFAAYYPFCDSSPELVALRVGSETGAALRFADLTWPEQVLAGRAPEALRTSLLEETSLGRSQYLKLLARRAGCRDTDELWDHLFEVAGDVETSRFVREIAAFCAFARWDDPPEALEADGTLLRERAMAAAVQDQRRRDREAGRSGPVLVVTGGYHTAALPFLLREPCPRPEPPRLEGESQTVLMRYSFDRLDALNGYGAGLPSPRYYSLLWGLMEEGHPEPQLTTAARIIVEIGRLTRERDLPFAVSAADEIAALEQARRLADLRGHPAPSREDLLDGLRGAFVKGAMDAEGALLQEVVRHALAGTEVGDVPPEAGMPPLVEDFRRQAESLGLPVRDATPRRLALEIYRREPHRRTSRLLHGLIFLEAPFAVMTAGPDFERGVGLDLLVEHWDYAWSPTGETALLEASVYGTTVEEAAAGRLRQAVAELETAGQGRSIRPAVRLLIAACRMGLHQRTGEVLDLLEASVAEDPSFVSLGFGLTELALLWRSREPLEAHGLAAVPDLARAAFHRACFLARDLPDSPAEEVDQALDALSAVREACTANSDLFDPALFLDALLSVAQATAGRTVLVGAAAGILFGEGRLSEEALLTLVDGHLRGAAAEPAARTGFLRGLLAMARETAWRLPDLLAAVDDLLASWDEEEFTRALPEMRLAFSHLTPRETDRVAVQVAGLHGIQNVQGLGRLVHLEVREGDVEKNRRLTREVEEILARDGLRGSP